MKTDTIIVQTIWQVMEALKDANQLEDALASTLDILVKTTKCEMGSIWMSDELSSQIIAVASSGPINFTGININGSDNPISQVINNGETLIQSDITSIPSYLEGEEITQKEFKNIMYVPLKTPLKTIGCLVLVNKADGDFDEDTKSLCENCGAIISLDIEDKGFSFRPFEDRKAIIKLRGLIKEFPSGEEIHRILKGIDLDVYEGELMVILGESGCGKSTMLNIIGGMDKLTDGKFYVEDKDMSNPTEDELTEYRRKYIGFIFQSYNLMPNLSALENIQFIAEISKQPLDSMEALEMVDMKSKSGNLPGTLSGGQMQRVSIARALVKNPKLILADEPTAALDYETSIKVLEVIEKIVKERKTTVLMVTHNPEIAKMANRVIKLRNGIISSVRVNLNPHKASELEW